MSEINETQVIIAGRVLTLTGYETEEYTQKVANYINKKLEECRKTGSFKSQNKEMQMLLVALNIADDYMKINEEIAENDKLIEEKDKEIYSLKHDIITTQARLDKSEEQVRILQDKMAESSKKLLQLDAKLKTREKSATKKEDKEAKAKEKAAAKEAKKAAEEAAAKAAEEEKVPEIVKALEDMQAEKSRLANYSRPGEPVRVPEGAKPASASEAKPAEAKPAADIDTKPAEAKPSSASDAKPADEKPSSASEVKPSEAKPVSATGASEVKPAPAASSDTKPADVKPSSASNAKPAPASSDAKLADAKPSAENKPSSDSSASGTKNANNTPAADTYKPVTGFRPSDAPKPAQGTGSSDNKSSGDGKPSAPSPYTRGPRLLK